MGHNRWSRSSSSDDDDEPAWSEVVTEILLSLLAQSNHQLKEVVFCVFKALGRELSASGMESLFAVITKKDNDENEEDEEDEEEDGEHSNKDSDAADDDDEEDMEDESDEEDDNADVDEETRGKVTNAL